MKPVKNTLALSLFLGTLLALPLGGCAAEVGQNDPGDITPTGPTSGGSGNHDGSGAHDGESQEPGLPSRIQGRRPVVVVPNAWQEQGGGGSEPVPNPWTEGSGANQDPAPPSSHGRHNAHSCARPSP